MVCITIWHTNILSQRNINQPPAEKWLQKWLGRKSRKAWCQRSLAVTASSPPSHNMQQHQTQLTSGLCSLSLSSALSQLFPQKMAKCCIRESRLPPSALPAAWCVSDLEEGLTANMTNHPQVVKLVRHITILHPRLQEDDLALVSIMFRCLTVGQFP